MELRGIRSFFMQLHSFSNGFEIMELNFSYSGTIGIPFQYASNSLCGSDSILNSFIHVRAG
jgi:hypothetical protein